MSYKTILVHVDESERAGERVGIAARLAVADGAHLIGAAATGVSMFLRQTVTAHPDDPAIAPYLYILRQRAHGALDRFDTIVQQAGLSSFERRLIDDEAAAGISLNARYCDLVVVGQSHPDQPAPALGLDFPEYVILHSGGPVLIVPYASQASTATGVGSTILLAWNGSLEARRAVHNALPLLKRAGRVEVAVLNPNQRPGVHGAQPGTDIALYLARHGVTVNVREKFTPDDIGGALLSLAVDCGADLLVMGCYGHSRLREVLLDGATRAILEAMTLPVLMSH